MTEARPLWHSAGLTHPGGRAHNEDFLLADAVHGIYVVADGVGGRDAGEIASRISCEVIVEQAAAGVDLVAGFAAAERAIASAVARGEGRAGMAATAVALQTRDARFEIAWLGDCRAYLWDGKLRLLTRDHSLVEAMLARGEINLQQAAQHPQRNVILAALGGEATQIKVGGNTGEIGGKGLFLLCSDGLCDTLDSASISEILMREQPLEATTQMLLQAAVERGCRDNVTVLSVAFDGGQKHPGAARYAHSVRTYDPERGTTLDETRPLVSSSTKVRRITEAERTQRLPTADSKSAAGRSGAPRSGSKAKPRGIRWPWWLAGSGLLLVLISVLYWMLQN